MFCIGLMLPVNPYHSGVASVEGTAFSDNSTEPLPAAIGVLRCTAAVGVGIVSRHKLSHMSCFEFELKAQCRRDC